MNETHPKVGVGVMVFKDGKVLLGKRQGAHGAGTYAFPGGHLEHLELFEECAKRECLEEAGIEIENIRFALLANVRTFAPKHYVHIGLIADWKSGEPQILEPEKCGGWDWYDVDNIPENIMSTSNLSFVNLKTGQTYFPNIE